MIINSKRGDRVFISWSGGKDAYLSFIKALEKGLNPVCLLSFVGADGQSRSHGLKIEVLRAQAQALGIDLHTEEVTWESYEAGFEQAIQILKEKYEITGGVFGDVNLEEHRQWVEKMAERCLIDYNLPLWSMEEKAVTEEFINRGGRALIVAIRSDLVDQRWLGSFLNDEYINYCLLQKISPCGEGGETHTLVVGGPYFKEALNYRTGDVKYLENHALLEIVLDKDENKASRK